MTQQPPNTMPSGYELQWVNGFDSPFIESDGFTHRLWFGGEMDLPWPASRNACFTVASEIAEACGYMASCYGDDGLMLAGHGLQAYLIFDGGFCTSTLQDVLTDKDAIAREIISTRLCHLDGKVLSILRDLERYEHPEAQEIETHLQTARNSLVLARVAVRKEQKEEEK